MADEEREDIELTDDDEEGNYPLDSMPSLEKRGRPLGSTKRSLEDTPMVKKKQRKEWISTHLLSTLICCSMCCLADIPQAVLEGVRQGFQHKTQMEKSSYIMDWIRDHSSGTTTKFLVGTAECCLKAWTTVLTIPISTYYSIRKKFKAGKQIAPPGNWRGSMSSKGVMAMVWIESFSRKNGDKMPDHESINLPCCLTKSSLYSYYKDEVEQHVSETQFYRIWREELCHIKIPKMSRFTVCDTCARITRKMGEAQTKREKKEVSLYREAHLQKQNLERRKYYTHCSKAKNYPDKYLSIIIDAMDQDKTSVPHVLQFPKSLSNLWMLRLNLTGVIVHGLGIYGFFDCFKWAHGSSYTVSILIHVLLMMEKLPPVLYLQLDNCPGSNKNKYMLGFLAALVQGNVFKKIKLSFLMVGHTHEDIDQLFSRFSYWLKHNSAYTVEDLLSGFSECYVPRPTGKEMEQVFDLQHWLQLNKVVNHSRPHVFKFMKVNDKVQMLVKHWSTDKEWTVVSGTLLKDDFDIEAPMKTIPPSTEKIDDRVESDVQTVVRFFNNDSAKQWWKDYFDALDEIDSSDVRTCHVIPKLRCLATTVLEPPVLESAILEGLPDLQASIPEVYIGKKPQKAKPAAEPTASQQEEPEVQVADLVLCNLDKYADEWPQMAKVIEIEGNEIKVHWFKGAKSTAWTPAVRRVKGSRGGKTEPFTETVKATDIWNFGFRLTPSGHLPKHVKEALDLYTV